MIPRTLIQNCGANTIRVLTALRVSKGPGCLQCLPHCQVNWMYWLHLYFTSYRDDSFVSRRCTCCLSVCHVPVPRTRPGTKKLLLRILTWAVESLHQVFATDSTSFLLCDSISFMNCTFLPTSSKAASDTTTKHCIINSTAKQSKYCMIAHSLHNIYKIIHIVLAGKKERFAVHW